MKRKMVAAWMAAMMTAMALTGCGEQEEVGSAVSEESSVSQAEVSAESSESSVSQTEVSVESSEPSVQESVEEANDFDDSMIRTIADFYNAQIPEDLSEYEVYCIYEYADNYRGDLEWAAYGNYITLAYYSADWDYIELDIDQRTGLVTLDAEIGYDDGTDYDITIDDVDMDTIAKALENPESIGEEYIYDNDALEEHDALKDLGIMYARLRELADRSFAKVPGVKDAVSAGLLPQKGSNQAADSLLSKELPFLANEHHFVDGQCTDCDVNWYGYLAQSILDLDPESEEDYGSMYGMENEYLLDVSDSIRYINRYGNVLIDYQRYIIMPEVSGHCSENNTLSFNLKGQMNFNVIREEVFLTQEVEGDEPDIYGRFQCYLQVDTDAAHLAEVLTSKEALMENSTYTIAYFSTNSQHYESFEDKTEEDILSYLAENNYTPITKEEMCDELVKNSAGILKAIDKSMIEMGTSLTDAGVHMEQLGK